MTQVRIFQDSATRWRFSAIQRSGNRLDMTSEMSFTSRAAAIGAATDQLGDEMEGAFVMVDGESDSRPGRLPPLPQVDRKKEQYDAGIGIEE